MHGYRVTLHSDVREVEATCHVVDDDGGLTLYGGDEPVERWDASEWLMIDEFGVRLSDEWPPDRFDYLVDEVATLLARHFGHYVWGLRDADQFVNWRCNDLESLTATMLERVGLTSDSAREHDAVRDLIVRHFHVESR
jgi:hypothetical protein